MNTNFKLDSTINKAFFEALRAGLWNVSPCTAVFEGLSAEEWKSLYKISTLQTVEGVVFDGLKKLDAELLPTKDLLLKWVVRLQQIEERNTWMNRVIADQVGVFERNDLFPLMQKGQAVAQYYNNPLSRVCGDIDWCFSKKSDYNRAVDVLKKLNVDVAFSHGYSLSYKWKGCDIEHHQDLIELRDPFKLGYLKKLEDKEASGHMALTVHGNTVHVPAPILNVVLVNVHILKHLVTYGVGARQLCDSAMLYHSLSDQIDGGYLKSVYKKLGILRWIYSLHNVLVNHIGLDPAKLPFAQPPTINADWMMEDVLQGGNFGFYDPRFPDEENPGGRVSRIPRLWYSFKRYIPLAPLVTLSSPFVILFSKIHR